jgi:uncharacterized protein (TIGR02001 family)
MKIIQSVCFPAIAAIVALGAISPAQAQEATPPAADAAPAAAAAAATPPITITGSATFITDYRFRGVSQTDLHPAIQGGLTIAHQSGFYVGLWGSNLAAWGTFGGANMELDVIGGYKAKLAHNATLDVGLLWYVYPGGASKTSFAEPYVKLSGTTGPLTLTAGVAYAPKQEALANVSNAPDSRGQKQDNLYVSGDGAYAIKGTPLTAKAHIGYSHGNPGLGPNGTSVSPTGSYADWGLGMDATYRNLTLNVSYIDTDISARDAALLQPQFSKGQDGSGSIAGSTVVASLTAAF